ncbi:hypothetical protein [Clostridium sp. BL-8]|uniref:hypothetical protein n=1 Tax=Clostridium sp. BL-8 TaxID=349938 RepID=UPI00098BDF13|nr:hypothetical protein [Clostridium sp. BL-8]OOM76741.1 hypothetical protein CLOBL_33350 [Clostridium sp. BL-8]
MIKIGKEDLLKNTIDYEEYSENIYKPTIDELRKEGLLQCGGCCQNKNGEKDKCNGCKKKDSCKK